MTPTRWMLGAMLTMMVVPPPVEVARDSTGQLTISVVTGRAALESKHFDCNGNLVSAYPVDLASTGARLDYCPEGVPVRLTAFVGDLTTKTRDLEAEDYSGTFGGVQLAREGRRLGIGIGEAHVSGRDGFTAPSGYLRLGRLKRTYVQADLRPPEATLGMSGFARAGIGFHQGDERRFGGLIGLAVMPYTYSDQFEPRVFGDFSVPVGPRWDLLLGAQIGAGAKQTQWAATVGFRVRP